MTADPGGTTDEGLLREINKFIEKYNDVLEFIEIQSNIDGDLDIRGAFAGDTTFRGLRFEMRNLASQRIDGQPAAGPTN